MPTFHFPLQTILELRCQAYQRQLQALARAVAAQNAVYRQKIKITESLQTTLNDLADEKTRRPLSLNGLRTAQHYAAWLNRCLDQSDVDLRSCGQAVDQEREKLAAANARQRAIEKLRERHWKRFRTAEKRREQAAMDEFAALSVRRNLEAEPAPC